jgi:hypothetical protein
MHSHAERGDDQALASAQPTAAASDTPLSLASQLPQGAVVF